MRKWMQYSTLLLLVVLFVYTGIRYVHLKTSAKVGEPAPAFELETVTGEKVSLADFRGKPVVLNFFTTWCGPCIDEMPELESFQARYSGQIPLLVIDRREPKNRVASFAADNKSKLSFLMDYKDDISRAYGIKGQPETMIIDGNGVVRRYIVGGMTADALANEVMTYTKSVNTP